MMPAGVSWWGEPGCHRVADGMYRIPLSMPSDGLRAVNVYALESRDGLVLIDGGWAVDTAMDELDTALSEIERSADEITDVYVTHIHRDHYTFAVRLREKFGTRVNLGRFEKPGLDELHELRSNVPTSSVRELRRAGAAALADDIEFMMIGNAFEISDWSYPDRWLDAGPLDVPDWDLHALHTPGHTKGHLVFQDPTRGLAFTGDHVLPTITPSIGFELGVWDLPLGHYLNSLSLLLERDDAMLLPAHGHPGGSVHHRVRALLDHHRVRFDQILSVLCDAGRDLVAHEVAERLAWTRRETPFEQLDTFNAMIATCETIAHLDVMVIRAEATSFVLDGVERFGL